jgi:Tfp pilus assembly protein PilN
LIEINLLPGSAKRSKSRGLPKVKLPPALQKLKIPKFDKTMAYIAAAWVVGLLGLAWLFLGARNKKADLEDQIQTATLDSTRLAATIASITLTKQRTDTIALKLNVVQDIDANRYVWSHLLDEAARAMPEHTWFEEIKYVLPDSTDRWPKFQLEGRAGNNFALTAYISQLEASPFIRAVKLLSSELVREDDKLVYQFLLEAYYEPPPPDVIETVPLFASTGEQAAGDSAAAAPPRAARPNTAPAAGQPRTPTEPRRPGQEQP